MNVIDIYQPQAESVHRWMLVYIKLLRKSNDAKSQICLPDNLFLTFSNKIFKIYFYSTQKLLVEVPYHSFRGGRLYTGYSFRNEKQKARLSIPRTTEYV